MTKAAINNLTKKLRQLEGPELEAAQAWLDQLLIKKQKQQIKCLPAQDLESLLELKEDLERTDSKDELTVNLTLKIDFSLYCDTLEEGVPLEVQVLDIDVQGKSKLAQAMVEVRAIDVGVVNDYDVANCIQDHLEDIKLNPLVKSYRQKVDQYRTLVEQVSQKHGVEELEVLDQLSDYARQSSRK